MRNVTALWLFDLRALDVASSRNLHPASHLSYLPRYQTMAKTSSASSGTRKKNAAKKAAKNARSDDDAPPAATKAGSQPGGGGKTKKDKQAQKVKRGVPKPYTPPPKPPAPSVPDPLDVDGLGQRLPGDLVVVMRRVGKKDAGTRGRGLDELAAWVDKVKDSKSQGNDDGEGWWVDEIGAWWVSESFSLATNVGLHAR